MIYLTDGLIKVTSVKVSLDSQLEEAKLFTVKHLRNLKVGWPQTALTRINCLDSNVNSPTPQLARVLESHPFFQNWEIVYCPSHIILICRAAKESYISTATSASPNLDLVLRPLPWRPCLRELWRKRNVWWQSRKLAFNHLTATGFMVAYLSNNSVAGISAVPHEDNLRYFDVKIHGPSQSPYEC